MADSHSVGYDAPTPALSWWVAIAFVVSIPLVSAWNAAAGPSWQLTIGRRLIGVTEIVARPQLSWSSFADGALQRWVSSEIVEAVPARALLVRLNNQILFDLFATSRVVRYSQAGPHIITNLYLHEYCHRNSEAIAKRVNDTVNNAKLVQAFYESRGKTFLLAITPSKASHVADAFVQTYPCPSIASVRNSLLPKLDAALRASGIFFVDTASTLLNLKQQTSFPLFPSGGIHWNSLGVAHGGQALIDALNAANPNLSLPTLDWTYKVLPHPVGHDADIFELMNLTQERWNQPSPDVTFRGGNDCKRSPVKMVIVGGSFVTQLAEVLVANGCIRPIWHYFYLRTIIEFPSRHKVSENVSVDQLKSLEMADVIVVEENELDIGRTVEALRHMLIAP